MQIEMRTEMRRTEEIKPYENNPRLNDDAVDAVITSIEKFGFRQPIVVDVESVIVVGHTRWKAAVKMGLPEVPVHVAADLTPEQARAYRLADNKTSELAGWDDGLLSAELAALAEGDIDMASLGFSQGELDRLLALAGGDESLNSQPTEEVPEQWLIVVTCENERQQKRLLKKFQADGLESRPVIS